MEEKNKFSRQVNVSKGISGRTQDLGLSTNRQGLHWAALGSDLGY